MYRIPSYPRNIFTNFALFIDHLNKSTSFSIYYPKSWDHTLCQYDFGAVERESLTTQVMLGRTFANGGASRETAHVVIVVCECKVYN